MNVSTVIATPAHDRRKYIGGADIAAILGISPWRTSVDLWADKTKPPVAEQRKRVWTRGERFEAVVAEMLTIALKEDGHDVEIIGRNRRFIDAEEPIFAAEIDYEVRLDGESDVTNVEIKTVHPYKQYQWGASGTDDVPVWYTAQAMWGLGVAPDARQRCLIAPLFGADELRVFPVLRDEETIAAMRRRAKAFWTDHVLTGVAPEPTELADLDTIFPREGKRPALIADSDLEEKYLRLRAIHAEIKARESEGAVLEFQLKKAMQDCEEILVDGEPVCTWKSRKTGWLDQSAFKEAHPKLHREFFRNGETRVFKVK